MKRMKILTMLFIASLLLASCSSTLMRYGSKNGGMDLEADFAKLDAEGIITKTAELEESMNISFINDFPNAKSRIRSFLNKDRPGYYLTTYLSDEFELLLVSGTTTIDDINAFIIQAKAYYREIRNYANFSDFVTNIKISLSGFLADEYSMLSGSGSENDITSFFDKAHNIFKQLGTEPEFWDFMLNLITTESTYKEISAVFFYISNSDFTEYSKIIDKLEAIYGSDDSAILEAVKRNPKIYSEIETLYTEDEEKDFSYNQRRIQIVENIYPSLFSSFSARIEKEISEKLSTCTDEIRLNEVLSDYSWYIPITGIDVSELQRVITSGSAEKLLSITINESTRIVGTELICTKLDEFDSELINNSSLLENANETWKSILKTWYTQRTNTVESEPEGNMLLNDFELLTNDESELDSFINALSYRYSILIHQRLERESGVKDLTAIIDTFPSYLTSNDGKELKTDIDYRINIYLSENSLFQEILNTEKNANDISSLTDLRKLMEKYMHVYSSTSPAFDATHLSTIQRLDERVKEKLALLRWLSSEDYSYMMSMTDPVILDSPLYYGHRYQAYRPIGKTLREILSEHDYSSMNLYLTNETDSWSGEIEGAYIDIRSSNEAEITFHLELQNQILIITNARTDGWESHTNYDELKKYWDEFMNGTIAETISDEKSSADLALWLYMNSL